MRAGVLLLLLALFANWPVANYGSWTGTENRRVEIAREMAETGNLIVPTLGLEPTLAKPPLYYWTIAASERLFGHGPLQMRLPSVFALWLIAWLAFAVLRRSHDEPTAWVGALGALCSPIILWHGGLAEIDPMFAALTAGSILVLGRAVGFEQRGWLVVAGLLGSAAMLTKGPPYFLFLLGPLLVWWRRARFKGFLWYVLPFAVPFGIYYWLLQGDPAAQELRRVAATETVDRLFTYEWKHVADLPAYAFRALFAMLPLGFFTFAEFRGSHDTRLHETGIQQRFCTSAALGGVLVLALFPGRATRYLLPAVLLFCFGVAPRVMGFVRYPADLAPEARWIVRGLGALGAIALCVLPWLPYPLPGRAMFLAAGLGLGPLLVTSRLRLVAFSFVLPVLAAWTVFADRGTRYAHGVRSTADVQAILLEEFEERDVGSLSTWGHFNYAHLFAYPEFVPGDEFAKRQPDTDWCLVEQSAPLPLRPPGYVDRVRIRSRHRSVVLQQRQR